MSATKLWRIEHGEHALYSLSEIVGLASALQIVPGELMRLPVPAPANGHTDSSIEAVRLTLDAIEIGHPGSLALPVAMLRDRATEILRMRRACQFVEVAAALPGLIRDINTTLGTGRDTAELLDLGVYAHMHVIRVLAEKRGRACRPSAPNRVPGTTPGPGTRHRGRAAGRRGLPAGASRAGLAGLAGQVAARHATAAALNGRPGDVAAPPAAAAELAKRFGA